MKVTDRRFLGILQCLNCKNPNLINQDEHLVCKQCNSAYPIKNSALYLLSKQLSDQYRQYIEETGRPINKFKTFIKQNPGLFQFLNRMAGSVSFFGQSAKQTLKKFYKPEELKDKIIINIGAGVQTIDPEVINLDIFPFKSVNLVTNATALPFQDNSIDMIISESTLEHIPNADIAIREINRVVKPGGFVYISIPFIMPFHASPNDYFRLTHEGLKQKFSPFKPTKIGMVGGPASALVSFLMHFLSLPFSLISETLYNFLTYFFTIILSPIRILDLVFYLFPKSLEAAAAIYFIGKKSL